MTTRMARQHHFGWTVWWARKSANLSDPEFARQIGEKIPGKKSFTVRQLYRIYESPTPSSQETTLAAIAAVLKTSPIELIRKASTTPVEPPPRRATQRMMVRCLRSLLDADEMELRTAAAGFSTDDRSKLAALISKILTDGLRNTGHINRTTP